MYEKPAIVPLGLMYEQTLAGSTRQMTICKNTTPDTDGTLGLGAILGPGSNPRPGSC